MNNQVSTENQSSNNSQQVVFLSESTVYLESVWQKAMSWWPMRTFQIRMLLKMDSSHMIEIFTIRMLASDYINIWPLTTSISSVHYSVQRVPPTLSFHVHMNEMDARKHENVVHIPEDWPLTFSIYFAVNVIKSSEWSNLWSPHWRKVTWAWDKCRRKI